MYITQKKYQNKLQKDFELLNKDELLSNVCLVKRQNRLGNLYIDNMSFTFWYNTAVLHFHIYLNENNTTYTLKFGDLVINDNVEAETLSETLSNYSFVLKFKSGGYSQDKAIITKYRLKNKRSRKK